MFEFINKLRDGFKSADMEISGNLKVGTLQSNFKSNFGLHLRVYKGVRFANPDHTLAKLNRGTSKKINTTASGFKLKANMTAKKVEELFDSHFGLKVNVAELYNRALTPNHYTLGEASRRIPNDDYCKEKFGMTENKYIKSKGIDTIENWSKLKYAESKLNAADYLGKLRACFSLNYPHFFIRVDGLKIKDTVQLKEFIDEKFSINFSDEQYKNMSVLDFEKNLSETLKKDVVVFYRRTETANKKPIPDSLKNHSLSDLDNKGGKEGWKSAEAWALELAVKYN